jgi:hypothetical protein
MDGPASPTYHPFMPDCTGCEAEVEGAFRFCPWCGRPQRLKLTEFFRAHPGIDRGAHRALRVSRYLGDHHVRFSVWSDEGADRTRVEAALSLDEAEAARLSRFLNDPSRAETETRA